MALLTKVGHSAVNFKQVVLEILKYFFQIELISEFKWEAKVRILMRFTFDLQRGKSQGKPM